MLSQQPGLGPPQKGVNYHFSSAAIGQAVRRWKAHYLDLGSLNMQFQQDSPKDKKITALLSFCLKTEIYRLTELYDAPLGGSTIFLYRSSTSCTPLEGSGLAELKYAFFSSTGRKTKKLWHSNLFLSMVF